MQYYKDLDLDEVSLQYYKKFNCRLVDVAGYGTALWTPGDVLYDTRDLESTLGVDDFDLAYESIQTGQNLLFEAVKDKPAVMGEFDPDCDY